MDTGFLITTSDTAVICNNQTVARTVAQEMVETAIDRDNGLFVFTIERRPQSEIKSFLEGSKPAAKKHGVAVGTQGRVPLPPKFKLNKKKPDQSAAKKKGGGQ